MRLFIQGIFLFLIAVTQLNAQYKGCLKGIITQEGNKKPIPEATVEILHQSPRKAEITGEDGSFLISNLAAGDYTLHIEAEGFAVWEKSISITEDTLVMPIALSLPGGGLSSQTVRGMVSDASSGSAIPQALIELLNYSPYKATYSDDQGIFSLQGVPVGRQRVRIIKEGYQEFIFSEVMVSAGKEVVLPVALEEALEEKKGTVNPILAKRTRIVNTRMLPSNQMALAGAYPFTIEDVQRFAGCLNDPARTVAASLAGTFNTNDSQNYIIARGNSPYGNAWNIEGISVENPNHFGTMGNTGAPFQVLNTNALANSDYLISAAPAEYGGAFSSIFDLKVQEGNNQRFEFTAQFSLLGGELQIEGPFKKGRSSFLVSYRYSLLKAIQALGIDITTGSAPQYQDLTFKLNFETKKAGTFSFFGIGGLAHADILNKDLDPNDPFAERNHDIYVQSRLALLGLKHQIFLNRNTYLRTTLFGVLQHYTSHRDSIHPLGNLTDLYNAHDVRTNTGVAMLLNSKINAQYTIRTGFRVTVSFLDIFDRFLDRDSIEYISNGILVENQAYFQNQFKLSDNFVLSVGLHGYYYTLNKRSFAAEPRIAANWYLGRYHTLSLAYGWHSKYPSFTMLFYVKRLSDGSLNNSNRNLGLIRSHHLNLSYNLQLSHEWRIFAEVYGQYLTNIPIEISPSSFSVVNYGDNPSYPKVTDLVNKGIGYNYGIELTVQKIFGHGYYATVCGSYFRSKYQGSDKVWRNTAFDAQYLVQLVAGKEFKIGRRKNNVFTMDMRFHHHGGRPYTPIDLEASKAAGVEVLDNANAFSERVKAYSRIDLKIGARFNHRKKRISHYFYFDVINVGNFRNELRKQYDPLSQTVVTNSQFGFLPNIFYQLRF